jgi:hypothetical protein
MGIKLNYNTGQMQWYNSTLRMHRHRGITSADFDHMEDMYYIQFEDKLLSQYGLELHSTDILDAKYQWNDMNDVVAKQQYLSTKQKSDLLAILNQNDKLFDGSLRVYPHHQEHIDINPDDKITCVSLSCDTNSN